MQDKVLFGLLAIVACASAASISGIANLNPSQFFVGGQVTFPRIPGINYPLFGYRQTSSNSSNNNNNANSGASSNSGVSSNSGTRIPFPLIPGVNYPLFGYRQSSNNNNNNNNLSTSTTTTNNPNGSSSTTSNSDNNSSTTPNSDSNSSTTSNSDSNSSTTSNSDNNSSTTPTSDSNSSTTPNSDNNSSTTSNSDSNSSTTSNSDNNSSTTSNSDSNSSTTSNSDSNSSTTSNSDSNSSTTSNSDSNSSTTTKTPRMSSRLGPFSSFLNQIPILNRFIPGSSSSLPSFPNIDDLISQIPGLNNRNSSSNNSITVPAIQIPGVNDGPYIPGVSEALSEARQHVMASLNITTDLSTGIRDAVQTALDSDRPAESVGIIMRTIAQVYSTVAANCPLIIVGTRVFNEGVRLAYEVARSIGNVAVGSDNNLMP